MTEVDLDALHPTYLALYKALREDDVALMSIFKSMSGQQVNLPVHLYEPDVVKKRISEQIMQHHDIDVNAAAERYGYSRRWINLEVTHMQKLQNGKFKVTVRLIYSCLASLVYAVLLSILSLIVSLGTLFIIYYIKHCFMK